MIMDRHQVPQSSDQGGIARFIPYATIIVLVVASWFVLFQPGVGIMKSASAQANVEKIGEDAAESVTENAGRSSVDTATEQPPTEAPDETGAAGQAPVETGMPEGELPPGESAETQPSTEEAESTRTYYLDYEGIGRPSFTELTPEQIESALYNIRETKQNEVFIAKLVPIMLRFQTMVKPPWEYVEGGNLPWDSGASRYSPFDTVGITGREPPVGRPEAIAPFPPLEQEAGPSAGARGEPEAKDISAAFIVVGILGEPGDFLAIVDGLGQRLQVRVGDEIPATANTSFVVTEISITMGVRIQNSKRESDTDIIHFAASDEKLSGVTLSMSY
jgi:hypothetical protein